MSSAGNDSRRTERENDMYRRISSAMASFCLTMPLHDAMRLVRDAGFDGLDFPLSVYSHTE